MSYTPRTWVDQVDQVDAANFNDLESRINSAVSSAVSAISNSQTALSGTVNLSGSNLVTVRSTTGNAFVIDATSAAQTVQTQGLVAAISNNQASRSGVVNLSGAGIVSVGTETGNAFTISASQSVQTQNLQAATLSGNTAGALAAISSGTLTLAGGNNITVSQAGNAVTISGPNVGGAQTGISGVSASDTLYTSGTVKITGSNMVTVRSGAAQAVVIDATQSVQPVGSLGVSGNTTGTTASLPFASNLRLAGGPNITLSQSSGTASTIISVSADNPQTGISSVAASNTTYTSGQVEFTGSNMVTVKSSANQRVVIDATQSVQPVGSAVPAGNTTGTTASLPFAGNVGIVGGPNVTISQSTGAASTNLSVSVAAQSAQTQSNIQGVAGSNTTYNTGTVELTGSNMITVKSSANQRLVIDATQTVQTQGMVQALSFSNVTDDGTVRLTGAGIVTVASDAQGAVVSATQSVQTQSVNPKIAYLRNVDQADVVAISHLSAISKTPFYFGMSVPGDITMNTIGVRMSAAGTGTLQSFSAHLGVYTLVNSTSMALLGSVSETYNASTGSSASWSGVRDWVMTAQSTHTALSNLTAGRYVFGMMFSAAATGSMNLSLLGQTGSTQGQPLGVVNPGANAYSTGTSQGINALVGQGSTTVNAMPANVSAADLRNQGTATVPIIPALLIRS